jgi:hypothetical protein
MLGMAAAATAMPLAVRYYINVQVSNFILVTLQLVHSSCEVGVNKL